VNAQEAAQVALNPATLEKKMAKSNEDILDEKANIKAKTWMTRGELFQDIKDVNIQFVYLGMGTQEAKIIMKEPKEIKTMEEGETIQQEYVYERINLIFENDALVTWKETKVIHPDPLPVALEAYNKALELDEKGKLAEKVLENLQRMKKQFENDAILAFQSKEFGKAVVAFEWILECNKSSVYENAIDTIIIYNTALAAKNDGDHEKAVEYFRKSADLGYGGSDTYYLLKTEYDTLKNSDMALQTLEEGYNLYPDTFLLIIELVNYHLTAGNADEGLKWLDIAKSKEIDNPSIFFAQGTLYEKIGQKELALEAYNNALEIDPDYFNAHFNIGALYFNNAVELYDAANLKEDPKEYETAKALADEELKKARGPMEKAHELMPTDAATLETLKTIYYRLQMEDKYQEVMEKIKNLE